MELPKPLVLCYAFELKTMEKRSLEDDKKQLAECLKRLSLEEGWLILF